MTAVSRNSEFLKWVILGLLLIRVARKLIHFAEIVPFDNSGEYWVVARLQLIGLDPYFLEQSVEYSRGKPDALC